MISRVPYLDACYSRTVYAIVILTSSLRKVRATTWYKHLDIRNLSEVDGFLGHGTSHISFGVATVDFDCSVIYACTYACTTPSHFFASSSSFNYLFLSPTLVFYFPLPPSLPTLRPFLPPSQTYLFPPPPPFLCSVLCARWHSTWQTFRSGRQG